MNLQRWLSAEHAPWPVRPGLLSRRLAAGASAGQVLIPAPGSARLRAEPTCCATVLGELPRLLAHSAASFVRS
ncbi:hypothetical protein RAMLITH_16905 [Ramlibacter sp. RBP-2]|uniref:Uncharacterized protein n=1 Tax=Ramlibacter lithotrophicus TaxID=2606681 RepID=A0A7X6I7P2_9BURK|nr:hypothetical protein [Ramlibacter lithotrophicus]NKE67506.1 hypothetical protein [Ramlibacter lithotrophicus]